MNTRGIVPRRPESHKYLRSYLQLIDRAAELKDVNLLENLANIQLAILPEYNPDVHNVILGNINKLKASSEDAYRIRDDETFLASKMALEKLANGDFCEAMWILEQDLNGWSYYETIDSDEFRPSFADIEDENIWNLCRKALKDAVETGDSDETSGRIDDTLKMLRNYMQKYYGPLIPTVIGIYRIKNKGEKGVSVQLQWVGTYLQVATYAPFYEQLDDYFINKHPVLSRQDFENINLPEYIGGYELESVERSEIFAYET